jgi:hypothetical protein
MLGPAVVVLIVLAVLAVVLAIGTVLLGGAIDLYNSLSGGADSPSSVPVPGFGGAALIAAITGVANIVVGFLIFAATGGGAAAIRTGGSLKTQLISQPIGVLVMTAMLTFMLPTTLLRGFLVSLCYLLYSSIVTGTLLLLVEIWNRI